MHKHLILSIFIYWVCFSNPNIPDLNCFFEVFPFSLSVLTLVLIYFPFAIVNGLDIRLMTMTMTMTTQPPTSVCFSN